MAILDPQTDWKQYPEYPETGYIVLKLVPGDLTCNFELQRATGLLGAFETIIIYPPSSMRYAGITFMDSVPIDGTTYRYRGRHTHPIRDPGPWSKAVEVQAGLIRRQTLETDVPISINLADPTNQNAEYLNVIGLGAKGDVQYFNGLTTTSGSVTASSSDNPFKFSDISKLIEIRGAGIGGVTFVTKIVEVLGSGSVLLQEAPPTSVADQPFRFGTDSTAAIQDALILASSDSSKPRKVYVPEGSYFVSSSVVGNPALQVQDDVTIFGDGFPSELVLLGPNSGPIIANSESVNRRITLRDIAFNGDKDFHDATGPGSTAIKFSGVSDYKLENVYNCSCSTDAFVVSSSEGGVVKTLRAEANSKNDMTFVSSSNPQLIDVVTTGSLGWGLELQATTSASLANTFFSREGSGSIKETGTEYTQFSIAREESTLLDLAIGRTGTFSLGKRLSLIDSSGLWARSGPKIFKNSAGLDIFQIIDTDSPVLWTSGQQDAASGGGTEVHTGLTFAETRENSNYDYDAYLAASGSALTNAKVNSDFAQIAFIGVNANDIFDNAIDPGLNTPQLESGSVEIRGALLFNSTPANRVFNQPLWYSVSLLSGSHNFYGQDVTFNAPVSFPGGISGSLASNEASQSFVIHLTDPDPAGAASGTWLEFRKIDALAGGPPDTRTENVAWYFDDQESVIKLVATASQLAGTPAEDVNGEPDIWPAFFSMSIYTGQAHFSGSKFRVAQQIEAPSGVFGTASFADFAQTVVGGITTAETASYVAGANVDGLVESASWALTASFAETAGQIDFSTGSYTGSFIGEFEGKVPSGSEVYHELIDLGVLSASFTASFDQGNVQKFTAGANISVDIAGINQGGVYLLEIDNSGNHSLSLPGTLVWSQGIVDTISSGSNLVTFTGLTVGTMATIVAKDIG